MGRLGAVLLAAWLILFAIVGEWAHGVSHTVVDISALVVAGVIVLEVLGILHE